MANARPADIFELPNLVRVELTNNHDLYGYLSDVKWNTTTSTLSYLALSESGFSGEIPESIGYLKFLSY